MRLAAALWRFWDLRRHLVEGRRRLESALRAAEHPITARAKALIGAADIAQTCGDSASGRALGPRGARPLPTARGRLGQCPLPAMVAERRGVGRRLAASAGALRGERTTVPRARRPALRAPGGVLARSAHYRGGDLERTRELSEEILREARLEHDPFNEGFALSTLAEIALDQGQVQEAVSPAESSYRIYRDLGDPLNIAIGVGHLARVLALAGKPEAAARVLASSVAVCEETGNTDYSRGSKKALTAIRPQLDEAAFADAWEQGRTLTADEAVALALDSLD